MIKTNTGCISLKEKLSKHKIPSRTKKFLNVIWFVMVCSCIFIALLMIILYDGFTDWPSTNFTCIDSCLCQETSGITSMTMQGFVSEISNLKLFAVSKFYMYWLLLVPRNQWFHYVHSLHHSVHSLHHCARSLHHCTRSSTSLPTSPLLNNVPSACSGCLPSDSNAFWSFKIKGYVTVVR